MSFKAFWREPTPQGDAVHLIVEYMTEALREDNGEDVILVYRSILDPTYGAVRIADP
jgi:hypothetical protein